MNPFVSGDLVAPEMAVACAVLSAQSDSTKPLVTFDQFARSHLRMASLRRD
jgi:hypothetical protein